MIVKTEDSISKVSDCQQRSLEELYGISPESLSHRPHTPETRKYFDSGDYAMLRLGSATSLDIKEKSQEAMPIPTRPSLAAVLLQEGVLGTEHPRPETIPRIHSGSGACSKSSPIRDRVVSVDDLQCLTIGLLRDEPEGANDPRGGTANNQD